ncbi:MAG: hypothetical protein ACRDWS_11450 [Acidimicrobiia bacterium]
MEKVQRLAQTLTDLAPDMAEWEAYDPPVRSRWDEPVDFDYPGAGYSDLAGRTVMKVARAAVDIMRILQKVWNFPPEPPIGLRPY